MNYSTISVEETPKKQNENRLLKAALEYAAQGISVFPLIPRSKKPLTENGFKDASKDFEQIRAWWGKNPDANIGIPTGKVNDLFVVDIDGVCPESFPALPPTVTVRTKKGLHYYYKYPEGHEIKSRTKLQGLDIDVRGEGGYIVAPPSVHPEGGRYEFIV